MEEDNKAQAIFTVLVISVGLSFAFSSFPKQEGAMEKALTLVKVGFAIAIPGWLIAAFAHSKVGAAIFFIGAFIGGIGIVIAIWKNAYPSKIAAKAMKIFATGFVVYTGGILFAVIGIMEEEKNFITYGGVFICLVGLFFCFLAVIEDQMRGP